MKRRLIMPLTIVCLVALPALAESAKQPHAQGIESKDYRWDKHSRELTTALADKGDAARGEIAYEVCRGCHKADASGRPDAGYPQLAGQHASVLIKQMIDVRAGRRDNPRMHPFIESAVVAAKDVPDIAAYLNHLPVPTTNRKGDGNSLARGKALYDKDCASCHGDAGEGDAKKFYPKVASQHYPYLYRESMDIRDMQRRNANPKMVKVLKDYADEDIGAVSDYMSRLVEAASPAPSK
jgi:cytochrome c553